MTIKELKIFAKENGFDKVIFRNRTTNQGDFCIFLYNKKIKPKGYCVGFDGDYHYPSLSLDNCIKSAYNYIQNYSTNNQ